jgi:hypothetical protein
VVINPDFCDVINLHFRPPFVDGKNIIGK